EIILKAVADSRLRSATQQVIIADAGELQRQAKYLNLPGDFPVIKESEIPALGNEEVVICDVGVVCEGVRFGELSAAAGRAAIACIETGARLCLNRQLDALATAPVNKEALKLAGSPFPGHTEMLTALCGAERSLMCFFAGNLRVILLTIHVSLADA